MTTVADLDTLRRYVGATTTTDDPLLVDRLAVARAKIEELVYVDSHGTPEIEESILLLANRLYKRRGSPEGSAGFGGDGVIVRIIASDPDIRALLERHLDMSAGTPASGGIGLG